ncbi:MAG: TonB family protein [Crocinitomicaceae bacterium]
MKIFILFTAIVLLASCGSSFNYTEEAAKHYTNTAEEFKGNYRTYLAEGETEVNSWYHYMTAVNLKGEYVVRTFFPEKKQITSLFTYKTKKASIKNGKSQEWYDDGSKLNDGYFKNGEKDSVWRTYYHRLNVCSDSGNYENGDKEGVWYSFDEKGRLEGQYFYTDNVREGKFSTYDTIGNIDFKGIYKADTIFSKVRINTNNSDSESDTLSNNETDSQFSEVVPSFTVCSDSLLEIDPFCESRGISRFIGQNFNYPSIAREFNIQGTAYIEFVVDKDGSVTEVEVIRGLCQAVADECDRVISMMPNWEQPGIQAGKPVKVRYTIPVKLRLG